MKSDLYILIVLSETPSTFNDQSIILFLQGGRVKSLYVSIGRNHKRKKYFSDVVVMK